MITYFDLILPKNGRLVECASIELQRPEMSRRSAIATRQLEDISTEIVKEISKR